jgi:FKBP-type peptidyl-prolyl cis-trans isomerase (trigger factor)
MHEASNRQENGVVRASICSVDLKSKETRENDTSSHVTHDEVKKSIDIIFENITYNVRLGFRKGKRNLFCQ